jgi:CTP:molybdopterin cytidylyltransferase MocA
MLSWGPAVSHNAAVTVAAVILAATTESALAEVEGLARVRRLADVAWSGGALPIVVVAPEREGRVASALAGTAVVLAEPGPPDLGPAAQMARGFDVAQGEVRDTEAALLWPARMAWAGPETVTSLIEAHGLEPDAVIRPAWRGERGWPALVPAAAIATLRGVAAQQMPDAVLDALRAAGVPELVLELGDPGAVLDASVARAELPEYEGPLVPVGGVAREWGSAAADEPDDAPLAGPSLAPYPQAADEDDA